MDAQLLSTRERTCYYQSEEDSDCGTRPVSYIYLASGVGTGDKVTVTDNSSNHNLKGAYPGADIYFSTGLRIKSETVSPIPDDRTRTTIGIGEEVTLWTDPSVSVTWSVTPAGGGSVYPPRGTSTTFTASKSPSVSTVHATIGTTDCTLVFTVIAPTGMKYSPDNADADGFPHTPGPPNNYIGNGRAFPITIQQTTVSFYNVDFQENKPGNDITWPDGTIENGVSAGDPDFHVGYNNGGISDNISSARRPYSRLFDPNTGKYVSFGYTINVPLEYKNQANIWTEFMAGNSNYHVKLFTDSGRCALRAVGNNTQESQYRGPWQD